MPLEVLQPGLATTVQDRGRFGYYKVGIPQGGAMDQYSAGLANRIVGNSQDEAVLECTYLGPSLRATEDVVVSVTGAPVDVKVNGEAVAHSSKISLSNGDELSFGALQAGARYYIGVRGGIDVPLALGSRSTYAIGAIGGVEGRALQAGDSLPIGRPIETGLPPMDTVREEFLPEIPRSASIRVMLGLYDHNLTEEGLANLTGEEWKLTPVADRMGLRFDGPGMPWAEQEQPFGAGQDPSNIVDAGYAVGSIQVPGGNQPIILHRDGVSGGGYAQVGTVISADMDLVARLAPGTPVRFVPVSMEEALSARKERADVIDEIWS